MRLNHVTCTYLVIVANIYDDVKLVILEFFFTLFLHLVLLLF